MTTNGAGDDGFLANLSDPTYDVTEGVAPPAHMHGQSHGNVRRFEHAGHHIEIETHYRITIDGQEFPDQLHVADDGTVHYHGYPQYRSPSGQIGDSPAIARSVQGGWRKRPMRRSTSAI